MLIQISGLLSSVQRLSPEKIEYIIQHHVQGDALGTVIRGDDSPKPWEQIKAVSLQNTDFPINLTIIKSNLLYVEEGSLSPESQKSTCTSGSV